MISKVQGMQPALQIVPSSFIRGSSDTCSCCISAAFAATMLT